MGFHRIKIPIVVQQRHVMFYRHGGDHTVNGFSYGNTAAPKRTIHTRRCHKCLAVHGKKQEIVESRQSPPIVGVLANALQDFGQDDAAYTEVFPFLQQTFQFADFGRRLAAKEVDPYRGVNEYHSQPRFLRQAARSPSHRTVPFN